MLPSWSVTHATPGYCYRCPYGLTYPACDLKYAGDVEWLIRVKRAAGRPKDLETIAELEALLEERA